jgi:hypothetical protein
LILHHFCGPDGSVELEFCTACAFDKTCT